MHNSKLPLGRALLSGVIVAGLTACGDGGSTTQSFDLAPSPLPTNVVENGSLENSDSEFLGFGWDAYTSDGSDAEATFAVTSAEKYRGSNAFMASITAIGSEPYHIEGGPVDVPVVAGETYAMVAWAKGTAGSMANFTASLAQEPWTTFGNLEVSFTGEWEQVAFTFTLPEDLEVSTIRLPVQMNYESNVGAEIYLDDMQLIPTDPPPPPTSGGTDLVVNGGLEDSDTELAGWGSATIEGTSLSVDTTGEAYEGSNALRVDFGTVPDSAMVYFIEAGPTGVPVTEGETYTYSAWIKGSSGMVVTALVQHPTIYNSFAQQDVEVTSDWQQVTFPVSINSADDVDPATVVRLYFQMARAENSGGTLYIDNVQLLTSSSELVVNGSLEASATSADGWGFYAANENADFSVTSSEAQDGSNSFLIEVGSVAAGGNDYDIESGAVGVPVVDGETYTYSAWVKASAPATAKFVVQNPSTYFTYADQTVDVTTEWQQVTFDVTIEGTDPTDNVRLYVTTGYVENSGVDIYLDNFSLKAN